MNDDELRSRLRTELDSVQPLYSRPRYTTTHERPIIWRFAPAALVASVISMLALSAYVATGSPNPADWGHDVVTIIQSSSTTPSPTPTSAPTVKPTPTEADEHESPEPTEKAEPPEQHASPEPSDDHSGEGSGSSDGGGTSGHDGGGSDSHDGSSESTSDSD